MWQQYRPRQELFILQRNLEVHRAKLALTLWRPHGTHHWLPPPTTQEDLELLTRVTAAATAFTAIGETGEPRYTDLLSLTPYEDFP